MGQLWVSHATFVLIIPNLQPKTIKVIFNGMIVWLRLLIFCGIVISREDAAASFPKTERRPLTVSVNDERITHQSATKNFPVKQSSSTMRKNNIEVMSTIAPPLVLSGDTAVCSSNGHASKNIPMGTHNTAISRTPRRTNTEIEVPLFSSWDRGDVDLKAMNSLPNWVGPTISKTNTATCLRRRHKVDSTGECPRGYKKIDRTCRAQCPLAFPVEDGAECVSLNRKGIWETIFGAVFSLFDVTMATIFSEYKAPPQVKARTSQLAVLASIIEYKSVCGSQLTLLTDLIVATVNDIRAKTPGISSEDLRTAMSQTTLALIDIPTVTNNCQSEFQLTKTKETAYNLRDAVRRAFEIMIDQLIETSTANTLESLVEVSHYELEASNLGLGMLSMLDPTGLAYSMAPTTLPVCGPTEFLGEVDDGSLTEALGLKIIGYTFAGSDGVWTRLGDDIVSLMLSSTSSHHVTVVIYSGSDMIATVDISSGETMSWNSTVAELREKTFYLKSWHRSFFGALPISGGSLSMWIPSSTTGGHLDVSVKIH